MRYAAGAALAALIVSGCGGVRKLSKSDPKVGLHLPAKSAEAVPPPADTMPRNKIITFKKQDGTELFFVPTEYDTAADQKLISLMIDEVVISASNRRNLVERNGRINVEFVVKVPEAFQQRDWQLRLDPLIRKGGDTLQLDPLFYSGPRFREMQERDYDRYGRYCDRIVDSADFFDAFGDPKLYVRYRRELADNKAKYRGKSERLAGDTPREAVFDPEVSWFSRKDLRASRAELRRYVRSSDRHVGANMRYRRDETDRYDHLSDYLAPRYRYDVEEPALPGGEIYTRVDGAYPGAFDKRRERYFRTAAERPEELRAQWRGADLERIWKLSLDRRQYVGCDKKWTRDVLRELNDSSVNHNYDLRRDSYAATLAALGSIDSASLRMAACDMRRIRRNELLRENKDAAFDRMVRYPYESAARLDTVIREPDGSVQYRYTEQVQADENTAKLYLFLRGTVTDTGGRQYRLKGSDTLTYSVASMTNFIDEQTRYMQRIITRDAEANARFFFTFPASKSKLDSRREDNRRQLAAVKNLTRGLMTDPIYIIDSITLRATASPEGRWSVNERMARERAEALREVLLSEFTALYDSLKVSANYRLNADGRVIAETADDGLPDLPNLLRTESLAEDWDQLRRLIAADTVIVEKEEIFALIDRVENPDTREHRIRARYPRAYQRMREVLYPQLRAVDFRFNLHRRGMKQDTVYTTEVDSNYMRAVELLKKRRYEAALEILRPYEDRNTALAYMSLGYDRAAYRILQGVPDGGSLSDVQYMLAILASRLGDEERAVQYFLRAVELKETMRFRGNLDPEISRLVRKYNLFPDM